MNLAKGLAAGIPLITTGFGGHTDFCKRDAAFLVPFKLIQASDFHDPWYPSGKWAEPSETAAIQILREVAALIRKNSPEINYRRERGRELINSKFSSANLKARIAGRLRPFFPGLKI